ncbi:MAG: hypothetical protein ACRYG5_08335 [Janthinobacterium lividum]
MALLGNAFMAIWNDLLDRDQAEYEAWITGEHMHERISAPGFLRGRRYISTEAGVQRYLNMYEAAEVEDFSSAAYLRMLDNPSPWTLKMMPGLVRFSRAKLKILRSVGHGIGGAATTFRFSFAGDDVQTQAAGVALDRELAALSGVGGDARHALGEHATGGLLGYHLGAVERQQTEHATTEKKLRNSSESELDFTHVLLVEAPSDDTLQQLRPRIEAALKTSFDGASAVVAGNYRLSYLI